MSRSSIRHSRDLLVHTNDVLEALRASLPEADLDLLLEKQRDAFSDYSRYGDTDSPLDEVTRSNIDSVLRLEELIVDQLRHQGEALMQESRTITNSQNLAKAFHPKVPDPPRFITRHV